MEYSFTLDKELPDLNQLIQCSRPGILMCPNSKLLAMDKDPPYEPTFCSLVQK